MLYTKEAQDHDIADILQHIALQYIVKEDADNGNLSTLPAWKYSHKFFFHPLLILPV